MIKLKTYSAFKSSKFKALLKTYRVKRIAVFGSYARGTFRKNSDIDFLVEFQSQADLLDQIGLKQDLESLFKKNVDVVTPRGLNRHIRSKILSEAVYI